MRKCSECFKELPLSEFSESTKDPSGKQSKCRQCQSAFFKAWADRRKTSHQAVVVESKVCRDCGLEKPISQFGKKSTSLDKHNIYCKPCWIVICKKARIRFYKKKMQNGQTEN